MKILVSGTWDLDRSPCFGMDHWVCGIVHAFNQIWIVEWSLGPDRSRWRARVYVSGNYQSSSPLSGVGLLVKLFHIWAKMSFSMLYFSKAWIAYSTESCWNLLQCIGIFDHRLLVAHCYSGEGAGWLQGSPEGGTDWAQILREKPLLPKP